MEQKDKFKGEAIETAFKEFKKKVSDNFNWLITTTGEKRKLLVAKLKNRKKIIICTCAGMIGVLAISTALIVNANSHVYAVAIDGKNIGYVNDREVVEETTEAVKEKIAKDHKDLKIVLEDELLACVPTDLSKREVEFLSEAELKKALEESEVVKADAWTVRIEDQDLFATATKECAENTLSDVQKHYQTEGSEIVEASFKEDVLVTKAAVSLDSIMKEEDAVAFLLTGTKGTKTYVAQEGDTYWDIARDNDMSMDEMAAANPGCDLTKLSIGREVNLIVPKPYVTVVLKEMVTATEEMDYETVYEDTDSLYAGQVKVKTEGVKGKKEIKTEIVKENGVEVAKTEVEAKVTEEPQNAVALKGTKAIVGYSGPSSGIFGIPMSNLQVSSAYGSRGGGRHLGVDLRNPAGTPIYVVESGVVTFSGYSGSYGNIVKVSHGNGLETYYAHCSELLVSPGQQVTKGQEIAKVGATGNATGNHLHFEVRLNGVAQNPWDYI